MALGGTGLPLPNGQFIPPSTLVPGVLLYPDEVAAIQAYIDAYNSTIAAEIAGAGGTSWSTSTRSSTTSAPTATRSAASTADVYGS